jgi:hypothetical protein
MPLAPDGERTQPITNPMATWIATMRGSMLDIATDQVMSLTRDDETTLQFTLPQPPIK